MGFLFGTGCWQVLWRLVWWQLWQHCLSRWLLCYKYQNRVFLQSSGLAPLFGSHFCSAFSFSNLYVATIDFNLFLYSLVAQLPALLNDITPLRKISHRITLFGYATSWVAESND